MDLLPHHIIRHLLSFHDLHIRFHDTTHAMFLQVGHATGDMDDLLDNQEGQCMVQRTGFHFSDPQSLFRLLHGRFARDTQRTRYQLFHNFHLSGLVDEHVRQGSNLPALRCIVSRYARVLYLSDCKLRQPMFRTLFSASTTTTANASTDMGTQCGGEPDVGSQTLETLLLDLENNDDIGNETLYRSLSRFTGLKVLLVEHSGDRNREDGRSLQVSTMCRLGAHLPHLQTLGLVNFNEPISVDIQQQQRALQSAIYRDGEVMNSETLDIPDFSLLASNCPNLTHLSVANHSIPLAQNIGDLFRHCPLRVLNCNFCHLSNFADIGHVANTLTSLTIRDNYVTNDLITTIAGFSALTNLALDSLDSIQKVTLTPLLQESRTLRKLHIGHRPFTSVDCLEGLEENAVLQQLHILHTLHPLSISALVNNNTLRTIYLLDCPITADDVRTMVSGNRRLEELTIAHGKIGNDVFIALWESCQPNLRFLNLSGNSITDSAFIGIRDSSPGSKSILDLYLDYNDLSLGDTLVKLLFHTRIERLSIRSNFNLSAKSILDVIQYVEGRRTKNKRNGIEDGDWMSHFAEEDDEEQERAVGCKTHIRVLMIDDGSTRISPAMFRSLKASHPALRDLIIH